MIIGIPAYLILSVTNNGIIPDEQECLDEDIGLRVSDYVMLPVDSTLSLFDGDTCLFEDGLITEYHAHNRFGGLLVEVKISFGEWQRLIEICQKTPGYVGNAYPNVVSFCKA
jgi:hypothetical protein